MKKIIILSLTIITVLASCEAMKVTSDLDPTVDFNKHKTYNVLPWDRDQSELINEFDQKRILNSVHAQMLARGYEKAESGSDISVSTFLLLNEKEQTTAYTNHYNMGGYGYYGGFGYYGFGGGYGMGTGYTTYSTEQYTVGTLIIDIFDNDTKKLIWQGIGAGTIKEDRSKRDNNIPKVLAKIMASYPVKVIKK